jgi:hypothetical protein
LDVALFITMEPAYGLTLGGLNPMSGVGPDAEAVGIVPGDDHEARLV